MSFQALVTRASRWVAGEALHREAVKVIILKFSSFVLSN
jgi:hypothetical protein